jgi:flagellar basal body-associated protein FliL
MSTEQLRDPQERANLKQRLLRSIESLLPNKDLDWDDPVPIKKVLVTEFYLQ